MCPGVSASGGSARYIWHGVQYCGLTGLFRPHRRTLENPQWNFPYSISKRLRTCWSDSSKLYTTSLYFFSSSRYHGTVGYRQCSFLPDSFSCPGTSFSAFFGWGKRQLKGIDWLILPTGYSHSKPYSTFQYMGYILFPADV